MAQDIDTIVELECDTFEYVPSEYVAPLRYTLDDAIANGDAYVDNSGSVWF